jgi:hypothetical protein
VPKTIYDYYYDKGDKALLCNLFYKYDVLGDETFLVNYPESVRVAVDVYLKHQYTGTGTITVKDSEGNQLHYGSVSGGSTHTGTFFVDIPMGETKTLTVVTTSSNSKVSYASLTPHKYGIRYEKVPLA